MKLKRILTAVLCGVLLFALPGCGDSDIDLSDIFGQEEEIDPYPLDTTVGFIYDGLVGSNQLIATFEHSRSELERVLAAETCYIENVRLEQFDEAVEKLIDAGCDVIVAASSHFNSRVVMLAREYIDILFISFGGHDQAPNLASIQPLLFQAAYINGFVAAYNTYTNKIGMVIDNNMYNAYGVANAFALGARELQHSQIELSLNWALSTHFDDTRRAIDDLRAQGCDIIFIYQSEEYGIRRCVELDLNVMGFAWNMPELAPDNYLTGMYINFNTYMIDKVRKYMYGNTVAFGDLTRRGLIHGTVEMIELHDSILRAGTRDLADALREMVMDGRSVVFGGEIRDRNDVIRVEKGTYMQVGQVFTINWLANNITEEKNFSEPITEPNYSDLIIKKTIR
ncbi:MAG: BMP family ABC transporter substrate-binding protein [Oscillospiraceae bacterium]|jgi:basic membrane lipoprotein Med (substrate-binding protein (PBP1-ABC) superfamily)|nr:BMP family ABC transporter substrate-binding protein [Oscillospiraceae bacterium]